MAGLIERLTSQSRSFDFFQALLLLEEYFAGRGKRNPLDSGAVRLESDTSLAFPPSDIAGLSGDEGAIRFALSFMGLVGASSPLPVYFSEYVTRREDGGGALRDFLGIFNHRLYVLFYRAWKKYRLLRCFAPDGSDPFTRRIASLAGAGAAGAHGGAGLRMLAYCGILAGRRRGGVGLCAILSDLFDGIPVAVVNWAPRWAPIRDLKGLGAGAKLGIDAMAGTTIRDIAYKFRVVIGPLRRDVFETFLPGSRNIALAKQLINDYIADPLDFDIEVQLQRSDLVPVVLGASSAALGRTSSLGSSRGKSDVQSVVIEQAARRP